MSNQIQNELMHYGVLGQRWGQHRMAKYEQDAKIAKESAKENKEIGKYKADKANAKGNATKAEVIKTKYNDYAKKDLADANVLKRKAADEKVKNSFREDRARANDTRSTGAKFVTNLIGGPFANRTYGSVIAAGGTKNAARLVTALTSVGGPLAHVLVSSLYTEASVDKPTGKG